MTFDGKAFGAEIVGAVKDHVSSVLGPILRRLDELEKRQPLQGERGADGAPGKDGRDGVDGKDGVDGRDGKDAEPITDEQIAEAVARYLTANPPASGKDGRDGKDGAPGRDGKDGAPGEKGADGRDGLNGKDGAPGRDGVGFDDLDLVESDEGVLLRFTRGDQVKSFRLPIVVDRGVWREGQYRKGDGVTWAGSFWIAQEDTTEKPDTGKGWRLAVKKGRDGK